MILTSFSGIVLWTKIVLLINVRHEDSDILQYTLINVKLIGLTWFQLSVRLVSDIIKIMKPYEGMTKDNTALLVIDPINSCAHERCETPEWNIHYTKIREMLPKLADFVVEYKKNFGGLVAYVKLTSWTKENLPKNIKTLYEDPKANYYSNDPSGFEELFHTVKPSEDDLVFIKNTYDAFSNEDLVKELNQRKIRYVVMTGIFTDGCVLATIVSGFSKGFNFVILKDLIETTDDPERQELQKLLIGFTFPVMYGKTITSAEFLV